VDGLGCGPSPVAFLLVPGKTKQEDKFGAKAKIPMLRMTEFGAKPAHSKIKLTYNDDALSVYIPPHGFKPVSLFLLGFPSFWLSGVFQWTWLVAAMVPFPINVPFLLFSLPFWGVGLSFFYIILFNCFGKTYLYIGRQMVSYERFLFGLRISKLKPMPTREIRYLTLIKEHSYQDPDGDTKIRIAELRLEGRSQKISLGPVHQNGIQDSSDSESIEWLAHEIREWLNVPMEIVDPRE
jgi:hypothetical protein